MDKCFWIVGRDNPNQKPAIIVETYDNDGNPIKTEEVASIPEGIWEDTNSSDFFRNC
jgi:hypothetical protein